jgi:long-chain acyl-CoA synthetase
VPASGGVDPAELFALGRGLGPLSTFAAPTIVKRLVDYGQAQGLTADDAAASFKTIVYGGAPMYKTDIERALAVMGPRFVQIYGQGETPMTATALSRRHIADASHPRYLERLGSVGVAQTPVRVRTADEQGRDLPPGDIGEVLVRGDSVMAGYWRNPEASAAALRDGWLWTGDVGCLDADGFLTLKDRSKDLIISGGSNIYPREVEEKILTHPCIGEVAVLGVPDPVWGEVGVAVCVAREGAAKVSEAEMAAYLAPKVPRYKMPKRFFFWEALPKSGYGKIPKRLVRDELEARGLLDLTKSTGT